MCPQVYRVYKSTKKLPKEWIIQPTKTKKQKPLLLSYLDNLQPMKEHMYHAPTPQAVQEFGFNYMSRMANFRHQ